MRFHRLLLLIVLFSGCTWFAGAANTPIKLSVDASTPGRHVLRIQMKIPATSGPLTLVYPKWIPGDHSPSGPINDVVALKFMINGAAVPWQRDPVDMYAFHLLVPHGGTEVDVQFDLAGPSDEGGFLLGNSATFNQLVLNWDQVVLYPSGPTTDQLMVEASLKLPADWKFGTALPVQTHAGQVIAFQPTTLTTLVDSPVLAGAHFREFDITPPGEKRQHLLDVAAESEAPLQIPANIIASYGHLVAESGALFKSRHYNNYHFLVSIHGLYEDGLEHHQSSDNRLPAPGMVDPQWQSINGDTLSHEMVHSWNGKYKRPLGLDTPDYQQPMKGNLLWVYEGLTNYLGEVLAARSGVWTPSQYRDEIAEIAAMLDNRPGRTWRSLQDTAVSAQILYGSPSQWSSWRRDTDFYPEGSLLWLEVDTVIRAQSHGTKSIEDFCREFYGGEAGPSVVVPYTFDDVVSGLNQVVPYDWRNFLQTRLNSLSPRADLHGIENSGWRLAYADHPSNLSRAVEDKLNVLDARYSIGALLTVSGAVTDVIRGTPAALAGLTPGMEIVAVDRHRFSPQILRDALLTGKTSSTPLDLLVTSGDDFLTLQVDYHGGQRYPRLERDPSKPDLLGKILTPLSPK